MYVPKCMCMLLLFKKHERLTQGNNKYSDQDPKNVATTYILATSSERSLYSTNSLTMIIIIINNSLPYFSGLGFGGIKVHPKSKLTPST